MKKVIFPEYRQQSTYMHFILSDQRATANIYINIPSDFGDSIIYNFGGHLVIYIYLKQKPTSVLSSNTAFSKIYAARNAKVVPFDCLQRWHEQVYLQIFSVIAAAFAMHQVRMCQLRMAE